MYMVVDARGRSLSEIMDERPSDELAWQIWDQALPLPQGNYPRVRKL